MQHPIKPLFGPPLAVKQVPVGQLKPLVPRWSQEAMFLFWKIWWPGRRPKSSSAPMPTPGYAVGRTCGSDAGEVIRCAVLPTDRSPRPARRGRRWLCILSGSRSGGCFACHRSLPDKVFSSTIDPKKVSGLKVRGWLCLLRTGSNYMHLHAKRVFACDDRMREERTVAHGGVSQTFSPLK